MKKLFISIISKIYNKIFNFGAKSTKKDTCKNNTEGLKDLAADAPAYEHQIPLE